MTTTAQQSDIFFDDDGLQPVGVTANGGVDDATNEAPSTEYLSRVHELIIKGEYKPSDFEKELEAADGLSSKNAILKELRAFLEVDEEVLPTNVYIDTWRELYKKHRIDTPINIGETGYYAVFSPSKSRDVVRRFAEAIQEARNLENPDELPLEIGPKDRTYDPRIDRIIAKSRVTESSENLPDWWVQADTPRLSKNDALKKLRAEVKRQWRDGMLSATLAAVVNSTVLLNEKGNPVIFRLFEVRQYGGESIVEVHEVFQDDVEPPIEYFQEYKGNRERENLGLEPIPLRDKRKPVEMNIAWSNQFLSAYPDYAEYYAIFLAERFSSIWDKEDDGTVDEHGFQSSGLGSDTQGKAATKNNRKSKRTR